MKRALARGEDINQKEENGHTGLMMAVCYGQNSIVELLMSYPGLNVNQRTNLTGWTALHCACVFDNVEGLKMLLAHPDIKSHNIKTSGRGETPSTPLVFAVHNNFLNCIKELLKVDRVDLDTRSRSRPLSEEVKRLIDEEKNRRKKERKSKKKEEAARLRKEEQNRAW